jgi:hypothetical protein
VSVVEEEKNKEKVPILELKDVTLPALELRLNLILAEVPPTEIKNVF